jgi:hypothetical protein
MKNLIFIIALSGISTFVKAQGNLQFNRVVTYNLTGNATTSGLYTIQTISIVVPANKVLKLESASTRVNGTSSYFYGGSTSSFSYLLLDNNIIIHSSTHTNTSRQETFPIWLSEGTHTLSLTGDISGYNGQVAYGMVTGIEFNVVP